MDATTTPSTDSLISKAMSLYPQLTFLAGVDFRWEFDSQTITYDPTDPRFIERLLHELGHALLQHHTYDRDIDLIGLERDAWHHAKTSLAAEFDVIIDTDIIQDDLDTYRDWLHARSTCPACNANGLQLKKHAYRCLACGNTWRVNEARTCRLRRDKA